MSPQGKLSFRIKIVLLGFLSILLLLSFVFPPLINQYSEPTIHRVNVSQYPEGLNVYEDDIYTLAVYYNDTWHNVPISNATLSASSSDPDVVQIISLDQDSESIGTYLVTIIANFPGSSSLTINVSKLTYEPQNLVVQIHVHWRETGPSPPPNLSFIPIAIMMIYLIYRENTRKSPNMSTAAI